MTDSSLPSPGTPRPAAGAAPHEVLAHLGELTRRVRAAQRGSWIPLLLLGVLTLGGILVNRVTFSVRTTDCPVAPIPGDPSGTCVAVRQGSPVYWTVGLVLVYAATAYVSVRRSSSRGVGTRVRPYVLAGSGIVLLVLATELWATRNGTPPPGSATDFWGVYLSPGTGTTDFLQRFTGAAASVGLPLLLLSWLERSRALALFTAVYLAVELAPLSSGWAGVDATSPWSALPRLAVPGGLLLLGAAGFAAAQLPRGRGRS